ncbi:MAG: TIGR03759 family integrating conjugative element protein, partial [Rhodocyclaceae bacterium]|nr:TIGR03759 family integrating conjugative element protein [Rhodocyclaceae bacterium]
MTQHRTATLLTVALLTSSIPVAVAQHTATSTTVPGRERPMTTVRSDELLARDWGLTAEDWARYRELMQGPLGVYSPELDPLTALGIEARSEEERR